jgi:hypothetical protein
VGQRFELGSNYSGQFEMKEVKEAKIITKDEQMDQWRHETRQLISVLQKKQ